MILNAKHLQDGNGKQCNGMFRQSLLVFYFIHVFAPHELTITPSPPPKRDWERGGGGGRRKRERKRGVCGGRETDRQRERGGEGDRDRHRQTNRKTGRQREEEIKVSVVAGISQWYVSHFHTGRNLKPTEDHQQWHLKAETTTTTKWSQPKAWLWRGVVRVPLISRWLTEVKAAIVSTTERNTHGLGQRNFKQNLCLSWLTSRH